MNQTRIEDNLFDRMTPFGQIEGRTQYWRKHLSTQKKPTRPYEDDNLAYFFSAVDDLETCLAHLARIEQLEGENNRMAPALADLAERLANTMDRLRAAEEVVKAAQKLKFGPYPAHGSGFVMIVTEGNINDLTLALSALASEKQG